MNSLPKTVTRQRRGCDKNPDPSAPESSMPTTPRPSHPVNGVSICKFKIFGNLDVFWHAPLGVRSAIR